MTSNMKRTGVLGAVMGVLGFGAVAAGQESKTPPVAGGQGVSLAPMFKAGSEFGFTQRIVRTDVMSLATMGDQTLWMDQHNTWSGKVISADDKGAVLEMQFKSIKVEMKQSLKQGDKPATETTSKWDSSKPEDDKDASNPLTGVFRPVVGARLKVTLDTAGVIKSVEALDSVSPLQTKYAQFVNQIINPEAFRVRWQPVLAIKTDGKEAFPGQDWTAETLVASPPVGQEKQTSTRTLTKKDGDIAKIAIKGDIQFVALKEGEKPQGEIAASQIKGMCDWDTKGGFAKNYEWAQKMDMTVNAQGFTVKRSYDWTMNVTRN